MALQVSGKRVFKFNHKEKVVDLEDPHPAMSPESVMDFYSNHYPELINGVINGPELGKEDEIIYSFSFVAKTKG